MNKNIDYKVLEDCIIHYDFPLEGYNHWAILNDRPKITYKEFINFLKKRRLHKVLKPTIYLPKEIEPKRIDYGEINSIYWEIWTNGCYPSVKIYPNILRYQAEPIFKLLKMPGKRTYTIEKDTCLCYEYNSLKDYYGGGHSYGYDSTHEWTIVEIFNDICKICEQLYYTREVLVNGEFEYKIVKEN